MSETDLMLALDELAKKTAKILLARNSYGLLDHRERDLVEMLMNLGYMEEAHSLASANRSSVASVVSERLKSQGQKSNDKSSVSTQTAIENGTCQEVLHFTC